MIDVTSLGTVSPIIEFVIGPRVLCFRLGNGAFENKLFTVLGVEEVGMATESSLADRTSHGFQRSPSKLPPPPPPPPPPPATKPLLHPSSGFYTGARLR